MEGQITHSQYLAELASRAEAGDSNAAFELGELYREGEEVNQDWKMALRWYHLGATQGDAESQNNLGTLYLNGLGCEPDSVLAAHWYRQSAEQGNPVAQFNLGKRFHVGDGVDLDLAEAAHWYTLAAKQGNTDAICDLGTMMRFGHGGPRNLVSAAAMHLIAAQHWDPVAIGNLCDYAEELQDIALSGNAKAAVHLSVMHNHGFGPEKSMPLTWTWIRWAKDFCPPPEDEDEAIEIDTAYEFFKKNLDPDDIEAGDRVISALQKPVDPSS
jgi:hypothetical protein